MKQRQGRERQESLKELYARARKSGHQPPSDVEAERHVLSVMLSDKNAALEAASLLGHRTLMNTPFFLDPHTPIYAAIYALLEANQTPDAVTVSNKLRQDGEFDFAQSALGEILAIYAETSMVKEYAQIVLEKFAAREAIAASEALRLKLFSGEWDVYDSLISAAHEFDTLVAGKHSGANVRPIDSLARELHERQEDVRIGKRHFEGISSGLSDLDAVTDGWQKKDMIVLGGRPSQGKTALALHFARCARRKDEYGQYHQVPTLIFSIEMGAEMLAARMISTMAGGAFETKEYLRGRADPQAAREAMEKVAALPIYIDEASGITPQGIRAKARRLVSQKGVGLIIVDYLQLMESGRDFGGFREQEVAYLSKSLKGVAKELDVPVIVLAQLNRGTEKASSPEPQLSNLRDSGAIEQDADLVLFIWRPEAYGQDTLPFSKGSSANKACISVAKHRNGSIGYAEVNFNKSAQEFSNLDGSNWEKIMLSF